MRPLWNTASPAPGNCLSTASWKESFEQIVAATNLMTHSHGGHVSLLNYASLLIHTNKFVHRNDGNIDHSWTCIWYFVTGSHLRLISAGASNDYKPSFRQLYYNNTMQYNTCLFRHITVYSKYNYITNTCWLWVGGTPIKTRLSMLATKPGPLA